MIQGIWEKISDIAAYVKQTLWIPAPTACGLIYIYNIISDYLTFLRFHIRRQCSHLDLKFRDHRLKSHSDNKLKLYLDRLLFDSSVMLTVNIPNCSVCLPPVEIFKSTCTVMSS